MYKINSFEDLLFVQTDILTNRPAKDYVQTLNYVARLALDWFKLDRLTLFPNSMILLDADKRISVSRDGVPPLNKQNLMVGNYRDYLQILRTDKQWQLFHDEQLKSHPLDPLKELYKEGIRYHGVVTLKQFGQQWGGIAFSRFNNDAGEHQQRDILRLKLISDTWLHYWHHATLSLSLNADKQAGKSDNKKLLLLSQKQCDILRLLAQGYTAKQIAEKLYVSPRTVESHKYRMLDLLDLNTHTELVQFALRNGLGIETS
ncbi:response regulator transcription factor [Vibrio sp. SCSIO 43135]|uniref:response regulator transcription factor n=1 Tax=Vibrio sp. SCSIO 43135 TaxID=2819096 RepID=UPI002075569D|nr:LuxR C-terminal-related transcriptional regulator [Vibrio sp. SCSIO 43135]USD42655.1 response regulator transcription factor [Vibrio sp. SCSIO 43135]